MENMRPDGSENQFFTFPSGEYLGRNFHVRHSECTRKSPQRYNLGFGAAREWNNDNVASIVYMNQNGDLNRNVDTDDILSLFDEWDAEDFIDTPSHFHMRSY